MNVCKQQELGGTTCLALLILCGLLCAVYCISVRRGSLRKVQGMQRGSVMYKSSSDYVLQNLYSTASFVACAAYSVKDHRTLPKYSLLVKKTCVRRVVLDMWFPLKQARRMISELRNSEKKLQACASYAQSPY